MDSPDSLENVRHKWIEEARERCPAVPIILVGLKKDLREDPLAIEEMRKRSQKFVTAREGQEMAQACGARKYLECSSLTGEGVDDVFEAATRAALLTFNGKQGGEAAVLFSDRRINDNSQCSHEVGLLLPGQHLIPSQYVKFEGYVSGFLLFTDLHDPPSRHEANGL